MYYAGQGMPRNFRQAAKWLRLAAEQGEPEAQLHLGLMHGQGAGVRRNSVLAYMWLDVAATNTNRDQQKRIIQSRDSFSASMTNAEINKAQELARTCADHKFKGCERE